MARKGATENTDKARKAPVPERPARAGAAILDTKTTKAPEQSERPSFTDPFVIFVVFVSDFRALARAGWR